MLKNRSSSLYVQDPSQESVRARVAVVKIECARQPVHRAAPEDGLVQRLHQRHLAVVSDGRAADELRRVHAVQERRHRERVEAALVLEMLVALRLHRCGGRGVVVAVVVGVDGVILHE